MIAADPIPALREDAATGENAAVFADLRATLGVPFVNLIWRHLATMPGMLEWTWALVKPLHASGALLEPTRTLRAGVVVPDGLMQPICVFDAVGVTAADRVVIDTILRDYNAANASNLLSLLVAQAVLDGQLREGQASVARPGPESSRDRPSLPRLLGLHELSPATHALVLELDKFGRFAPTQAIASLYRHLGHWPGFLAVAHAALSVPHGDGRLRAEHGKIRDLARTLAFQRILPLVAVSPTPDSADVQKGRASLEIFTRDMIGRMVVMGELMLALLPK